MVALSNALERMLEHSQRPARRPGPEVISLASGDPDFPTPPHIRRALIEALESGYTHYSGFQGDPELREALAHRLSRRAGRSLRADDIVVTHGGTGALAATILALVNPNDRVLLPEPTYSLYTDLLRLVGAQPVFVQQLPDYHLNLAALEAAAPGARMIIICHPGNPTGVIYSPEELDQLAHLARKHDLLVVSDEAYDHIVFDGVEFVSALEIDALRDRLIYCQTFSKTYAMTGWRIGYVWAPTPIASAIGTMHRTFNGPLNSAVQRAALSAITTPDNSPEQMRREYQARRELVLELLAGTPGVDLRPPEATFYAFIRYEAKVPSVKVAQTALEYGVAVRSGSEFGPGGEGHVRVAFSTDRERLREGIRRLRSCLEALSQD